MGEMSEATAMCHERLHSEFHADALRASLSGFDTATYREMTLNSTEKLTPEQTDKKRRLSGSAWENGTSWVMRWV